MKLGYRQIFTFGILAILLYLILTLTAFLFYAGAYSPMTNWLSDLGNPRTNPSGWIYYNSGCIITSLFLVLFYIALRRWNTGDKKMNILLIIAQFSGILSSCALIVSAVFPLGVNYAVHSFASAMMSVFLGFFLTFSATALLKHPAFMKWIAYYGLITALINFIYGAFLHSVMIAEWVAIGMFIIYLFLISYNSKLLTSQK
jgi:hypothetical protein